MSKCPQNHEHLAHVRLLYWSRRFLIPPGSFFCFGGSLKKLTSLGFLKRKLWKSGQQFPSSARPRTAVASNSSCCFLAAELGLGVMKYHDFLRRSLLRHSGLVFVLNLKTRTVDDVGVKSNRRGKKSKNVLSSSIHCLTKM